MSIHSKCLRSYRFVFSYCFKMLKISLVVVIDASLDISLNTQRSKHKLLWVGENTKRQNTAQQVYWSSRSHHLCVPPLDMENAPGGRSARWAVSTRDWNLRMFIYIHALVLNSTIASLNVTPNLCPQKGLRGRCGWGGRPQHFSL